MHISEESEEHKCFDVTMTFLFWTVKLEISSSITARARSFRDRLF